MPGHAAQAAAVLSHHDEIEMNLLRPSPYHGRRIVHFDHTQNASVLPFGGQLVDFPGGVIVEVGTQMLDARLGHTELPEVIVIRHLEGMQQTDRRVRRQRTRLVNRGGRPLGQIDGHADLAIGCVGFLLDDQNRPCCPGEDVFRSGADKQFIGKMFAVASKDNQIRIA